MKRIVAPIIMAIGITSQMLPAQAQNLPAEVDGQKFTYKKGKTYKVLPNGDEQLVQPFGKPFTGNKGPKKPTPPTATSQGKKYIFQGGTTYEVKPGGTLTPVDFFNNSSATSSSSTGGAN